MLKCVNLIEIRFYAYTSVYIFMHHPSLYFDIIIFLETTVQIPEVEFGGKYGYMREN